MEGDSKYNGAMKVTRGCTYAALAACMLSEVDPTPATASEIVATHNQHVESERVIPEPCLSYSIPNSTVTVVVYSEWLLFFPAYPDDGLPKKK
jgi:hypothetical protein